MHAMENLDRLMLGDDDGGDADFPEEGGDGDADEEWPDDEEGDEDDAGDDEDGAGGELEDD